MQTYLVGGAVRNQILELPIKDYDYVVVGSSVQEMLDAGYSQVGSHFPVFLHPTTNHEYALARTEQSTGNNHTDFSCITNNVSLKEDLYRRDFTINAIAEGIDGTYYDYYGGLADLTKKQLRHISEHFKDDPLRVLRGARFAAQLRFAVADETMQLMRDMVANNMLATLPMERIKGEFDKALMSDSGFHRFINVLQSIGALDKLLHVFNINDNDFFDFSNNESYTARIFEIAIACAEFNVVAFPCKIFIGAKLYKQTQYLVALAKANVYAENCASNPELVLPFINQTIREMFADTENNLQTYADLLWWTSGFALKLHTISNILSKLNQESFEGMPVQDIKNKKLDIVRQHGLANLG